MADKNYSEAGFWQKLNTFARKAGHNLVEKSLQLYYAAESPDTPSLGKRCGLWRTGLFRSTD